MSYFPYEIPSPVENSFSVYWGEPRGPIFTTTAGHYKAITHTHTTNLDCYETTVDGDQLPDGLWRFVTFTVQSTYLLHKLLGNYFRDPSAESYYQIGIVLANLKDRLQRPDAAIPLLRKWACDGDRSALAYAVAVLNGKEEEDTLAYAIHCLKSVDSSMSIEGSEDYELYLLALKVYQENPQHTLPLWIRCLTRHFRVIGGDDAFLAGAIAELTQLSESTVVTPQAPDFVSTIDVGLRNCRSLTHLLMYTPSFIPLPLHHSLRNLRVRHTMFRAYAPERAMWELTLSAATAWNERHTHILKRALFADLLALSEEEEEKRFFPKLLSFDQGEVLE